MSYPALGFPPPEGQGRQPDYVDYTAVDYPEDEAPPPPGGPPPNRRTTWWAVAAAAAVVILGVGLVLAVTGDDAPPSRDAEGPTAVALPPGTVALPPPPASPPPPRPCDPAGPGPQTPAGWQPVSSDLGLSYDVPPDWTVQGCGVRLGWEKQCAVGLFGACPIEVLRAGAQLEADACSERWRAVSGLDGPDNPQDINRTVREKSRLVADIYTSGGGQPPQVSLSDPSAVIVDGTPALQVTATVTAIETGECAGPSALHRMVATTVPGRPGSVVLVVSMDQGYPGAPDATVIDQIVETLRHS